MSLSGKHERLRRVHAQAERGREGIGMEILTSEQQFYLSDEARRLYDLYLKATPGEWSNVRGYDGYGGGILAEVDGGESWVITRDADFIAAAHNGLVPLLRALSEAREENALLWERLAVPSPSFTTAEEAFRWWQLVQAERDAERG